MKGQSMFLFSGQERPPAKPASEASYCREKATARTAPPADDAIANENLDRLSCRAFCSGLVSLCQICCIRAAVTGGVFWARQVLGSDFPMGLV